MYSSIGTEVRDELRYARIAMLIGVPVASLGLAGWLLTK
jgi:hypothetical protein